MFGSKKSEAHRPLERSAELEFQRFTPWSPVPGNPYLNEEVKQRQARINEEKIQLFMFPPKGHYIPDVFRDMLFDDHIISFQRRCMLNFERFSEWHGGVDDSEVSEVSRRVEDGSAKAIDVIRHLQNTTAESAEIGKITHPHRQGIEHVSAFRTDVSEAITEAGGLVVPSIQGYRSIDITPHYMRDEDNALVLQGFIANYKHDIGIVPTDQQDHVIKVVERQIAGYRVDALSGFDQDIVAQLTAELDEFDKMKHEYTEEHDAMLERILDQTGCREFIERAIQSDSLEDFVVPVSTTIYGYREQKKSAVHAINRKAVDLNDMVFLNSNDYRQ